MQVKPGMEMAAAFLETRRYASMMNGTSEWEKMEGITYSNLHKQVPNRQHS
jgi:hypothetical protein